MSLKYRVAALSVLALFLGFLAPQAVFAAATRTISFSITDSAGNLFPGAQVGVIRWVNQSRTVEQLVTADAQGRAQLALNPSETFSGFTVHPPVNNLSHASITYETDSFIFESAIAIQLKVANQIFELRNSDGTLAPPGTSIYLPDTATGDGAGMSLVTARTGPFGLSIDPGMPTGFQFTAHVSAANEAGDETGAEFKVVKSASSLDFYSKLQPDSEPALPKNVVSGQTIQQLKTSKHDLSGQLRSTTGQALALPDSVTGRGVNIYRASGSDQAILGDHVGGGFVRSDGSIRAAIYDRRPGKLLAVFDLGGSASVPSFIDRPLWLNASGQFSRALQGPFVSPADFNFQVEVPRPNLVLKIALPEGVDEFPSGAFLRLGPEHGIWATLPASGVTSFFVAASSSLTINPESGRFVSTEYGVNLSNGSARVRTSAGVMIQPDQAGITHLALAPPNLRIRVSESSELTQSQSLFFEAIISRITPSQSSPNEFYLGSHAGQLGGAVDNGIYRLTLLSNRGWTRTYLLTVEQGIASLRESGSNLALVGTEGLFTISQPSSIVRGVLRDVAGNTLSARVNLRLERYDAVDEYWGYFQNQVLDSRGGFVSRPPSDGSTYRFRAFLGESWGQGQLVGQPFTLTSQSSALDLGELRLRNPQMIVRVMLPGSSSWLSGAGIAVRSLDQLNQSQHLSTSEWGTAGILFDTPGRYELRLSPRWGLSSALAVGKSYLVSVSESPQGLVASVQGVTPVDGVFSLSLGAPQLIGTVRAPDGSLLTSTQSAHVALERLAQSRWSEVDSTNASRRGEFGFGELEPGDYRLVITSNGVPNAATTRTAKFTIPSSDSASVLNLGSIRLVEPIAKFRILELDGSAARSGYISVSGPSNSRQSIWIGDFGWANFRPEVAGDYEITVHPGYQSRGIRNSFRAVVSEVAGDLTLEIAGLQPDNLGILSLALGRPNLVGNLVGPDGASISSLIPRVWVNGILQRKNPTTGFWQGLEWFDVDYEDGYFGLQIKETGEYRLQLRPWSNIAVSTTFTPVFQVADTVSFTLNLGNLSLNPPSLRGTVFAPDGGTPVRGSSIRVQNLATGEQLWELGTNTDGLGRFALSLPEGRYSLTATKHYESHDSADSDPLGPITVDSNGQVAFASSVSPTSISLLLTVPTWRGLVLEPTTDTPVPNAYVCLSQNQGSDWRNTCVSSNRQGQWSLKKWGDFTGFNSSTRLRISVYGDRTLAERTYVGTEEVLAALQSSEGPVAGLVLRPARANFEITVLADGVAVPGAWLWASDSNGQHVGYGHSDSQGRISMLVTTLSQSISVRITVPRWGDFAETHADTEKIFLPTDINQGLVDGVFKGVVSLATPNFSLRLFNPHSAMASASPAADASVSVFDESGQRWIQHASANSNGVIRMHLKPTNSGLIRYQVRAQPNWKDRVTLSETVLYAEVNSAGVVRLSRSSNQFESQVIQAQAGLFTASYSVNNVRGRVAISGSSEPVGAIGSWISIRGLSSPNVWHSGASPDDSGAFGLSLADGSYSLVAHPNDWRRIRPSAACSLTVAGPNLSGTCVQNGEIALQMRQPNVEFILQTQAGQRIQNAHVHLGLGNWGTSATSDEEGRVKLLIDESEIAFLNPQMSGAQKIRVHVWIPESQVGAVGWNCSSGDAKPICNILQDFSPGFSASFHDIAHRTPIRAIAPNLLLKVVHPLTGEVLPKAHVSLLFKEQGWSRWLTSGTANDDGIVKLDVPEIYKDNPTARFEVRVDAPWDQRTDLASFTFKDRTFAQLGSEDFSPKAPNLRLRVNQSDDLTANRWSWVSVEAVNPNNDFYPTAWLQGSSTNELGDAALFLPANAFYRLTLHPGHRAEGTRTYCLVEVDTDSVVTPIPNRCSALSSADGDRLVLSLSRGNFAGRVLSPIGTNVGVEGAIVFAEAYNVTFNGSSEIETLVPGVTAEALTNRTGEFWIQLDPRYRWKLKVFYVNPPSTETPLASMLVPFVPSTNDLLEAERTSVPVTAAFTLAPKP